VLHLLVVLTVAAVVAGHGYWDRSPHQFIPTPTDANRDLRLGELPTTIDVASTIPLAVGGGASDFLAGYLSQPAIPVSPGQLTVTTVVAKNGQSIADIAQVAGRKINTLLWANALSDPAKPLPVGTQVRVPPVDGMLHIVHDGDTLESIAARYRVEVSAITGYAPNNVQTTADLVPYRMVMVPGGTMPSRDKVVTYVVREGDTLATIAQYFGLKATTIVWANSLPNGNLIFPGQKLAILPTDGLMVAVKEGDTVESLASTYGVDAKAIRDYPLNGLGGSGQLRVEQLVMIPGGEPPAPPPPPPPPPPPEPAPEPQPPPPVQQAAEAPAPAPAPAPARGTGRVVWPTTGAITQYYGPTSLWLEPPYLGYAHFHQGLDIANGMYTPIVAADAGTIVFAGCNTAGYGYAVSIDHGNGLVTWYGHMAEQPAVRVGQWVAQGQYIGPMGSTGASTGSHTHFGVLKNGVWDDPLKYLP
jgi:murein DD-endopeptidase MepM/ murein hydrolase activator NlpD